MKPYEPNTINAMALNIGRKLKKEQWFDMSAVEAQGWCEQKAMDRGIKHDVVRATIALKAMHFVTQQNEIEKIT